MKIANIVEELNNVFPDKFYIGGSFARNEILGKPHNSHSDIDFYTNLSITRAGFIKVLENIIFEGKDITVYPNMGLNEYKMPNIRKRVEIASEGRRSGYGFYISRPRSKRCGSLPTKKPSKRIIRVLH